MKAIFSAVWPYAACACFGAGIAWFITSNSLHAEIARLNSIHATEMKSVSEEAAKSASESISRVNALQYELARLDTESTQELSNAQRANTALRNDVATGKRRVLIAESKLSTCSRTADSGSGTGSVGDAAQVGLSAETGSDIYDIRSGIISDQAKIDYLQGYIRKLQAQGFIAADKKKAP